MKIGLLAQARMWNEEANELLADSNLLKVLNTLGEAKMTGSYKYGLMLKPDIDIYLVTNKPSKVTATKLLNTLVDQGYWNGYIFYDWVNFKSKVHKSFPKAFYIGLKTTHSEIRWKVDIWLVSLKQYNKLDSSWITDKLDDKNKDIILHIKQALNNKQFDTSSYTVYDAVLNNGVSTLLEFKHFLGEDL